MNRCWGMVAVLVAFGFLSSCQSMSDRGEDTATVREPAGVKQPGGEIYEVWNSFNRMQSAVDSIARQGDPSLSLRIKRVKEEIMIVQSCIDNKAIGAMDIVRACQEGNGQVSRSPHPHNTISDLQDTLSRALNPREAPSYPADEVIFDTKYSYRQKTNFNEDGVADFLCRTEMVHLISNPEDFMGKFQTGIAQTVGAESFQVGADRINPEIQRIVESTKAFAASMTATQSVWSQCRFRR